MRNDFHLRFTTVSQNIHVEDQGKLHFWISLLIIWNVISIGCFNLLSCFLFATSVLPRAFQSQSVMRRDWRRKKRNPQVSSRGILFSTDVNNSWNINLCHLHLCPHHVCHANKEVTLWCFTFIFSEGAYVIDSNGIATDQYQQNVNIMRIFIYMLTTCLYILVSAWFSFIGIKLYINYYHFEVIGVACEIADFLS